MESLILEIRAALEEDASAEVRAAGAQACRTILAALEATHGETISVPVAQAPDANAPAQQLAQVAAALRSLPVDQLLDVAIARMRAALPGGIEAPRVEPLKFHIIQL